MCVPLSVYKHYLQYWSRLMDCQRMVNIFSISGNLVLLNRLHLIVDIEYLCSLYNIQLGFNIWSKSLKLMLHKCKWKIRYKMISKYKIIIYHSTYRAIVSTFYQYSFYQVYFIVHDRFFLISKCWQCHFFDHQKVDSCISPTTCRISTIF